MTVSFHNQFLILIIKYRHPLG